MLDYWIISGKSGNSETEDETFSPKILAADTQTQYDQKLEAYLERKVICSEETQNLLVDKGTQTTDVISLLKGIKKQNEEILKDLKQILEGNIYCKSK